MKNKRPQTIVIGGGQAGLAVGYYLSKRRQVFQILDASPRIGDAWRNRWDSLRLFTTARYAGLPGLPFPARGDTFPTKQQMADYLERYAAHFHLPVQSGVKVDHLTRRGNRFALTAGNKSFESDNVVVAMADYQIPEIPEFAGDLDSDIVQLHSHYYKNTSQLREGGVLVVGAGNSGAEIAIEVVRSHTTWISGKESGYVPFAIDSFIGRFLLVRLVRFIGHHLLTVRTPIGRKLRPKLLSRASPLFRVRPQDLTDAGVERVPRIVGARSGLPLLADDRTVAVKNVVWCTGYRNGFSWIGLPVFGEDGRPIHESGIVPRVPGLYFVGLHYLYAMTSATVVGIGRDAKRVVRAIQARNRFI